MIISGVTDGKSFWLVFLFQLCIIGNYAFDLSEKYYFVSKSLFCIFILLSIWDMNILRKEFPMIFVIPFVFVIYVALSFFWCFKKEPVFEGVVTLIQYFLLFISTFHVVSKYRCERAYLSSVYIASYVLMFLAFVEYDGLANFLTMMSIGERLGGLIGNENIFGMTFSVAVLISVHFFCETRKKIHVFSAFLFFFMALSAQSKKGLILILGGMLLYFLFLFGFRKIWKTILVVVIGCGGFYYILQLDIFEGINERMELFLNGKSDSDSLRALLVQRGIELFKSNPLLGYGYENYRYVANMHNYSPHNNFIFLLVDTGLIGFILYYISYIYALIKFVFIFLKSAIRPYGLELFFVLLLTDIFIGYGMVQVIEKTTWISLAVYLAFVERNNFFKEVKNG